LYLVKFDLLNEVFEKPHFRQNWVATKNILLQSNSLVKNPALALSTLGNLERLLMHTCLSFLFALTKTNKCVNIRNSQRTMSDAQKLCRIAYSLPFLQSLNIKVLEAIKYIY
jgi:hypothetical protein